MASANKPDWLAAGLDHLWPPYTQMKTAPAPLPVVRTEGCRIFLDDGRVLIDGIASWWTACHGYNHPHIAASVARQLEQMPHVMFAGLVHEPAARLATRLAVLLPGDLERVFFSESGSVAVEIGLKIARQYWRNRGEHRGKFVAFRDGYHGDTAAAICCRTSSSPICRAMRQARHSSTSCLRVKHRTSPRSSSSRWCKGRAA
jgi:adenosylmethionine---8-amino-7-oxononanoate aminotransferase